MPAAKYVRRRAQTSVSFVSIADAILELRLAQRGVQRAADARLRRTNQPSVPSARPASWSVSTRSVNRWRSSAAGLALGPLGHHHLRKQPPSTVASHSMTCAAVHSAPASPRTSSPRRRRRRRRRRRTSARRPRTSGGGGARHKHDVVERVQRVDDALGARRDRRDDGRAVRVVLEAVAQHARQHVGAVRHAHRRRRRGRARAPSAASALGASSSSSLTRPAPPPPPARGGGRRRRRRGGGRRRPLAAHSGGARRRSGGAGAGAPSRLA